ncbi:MAG: hypothetical protein ACXU8U_09520 [Asticcacaulis sp.]
MTVRRKASIPARNLLTNKRDNESDLGGARVSNRQSADDIPPPCQTERDLVRKTEPR